MTHLEIKRRIVGTRRDDLVTLPSGDLYDVIALYEATAEREATLREAAEQMLAVEYVTVGAVGGQLSPQYMAAQTALRNATRKDR